MEKRLEGYSVIYKKDINKEGTSVEFVKTQMEDGTGIVLSGFPDGEILKLIPVYYDDAHAPTGLSVR